MKIIACIDKKSSSCVHLFLAWIVHTSKYPNERPSRRATSASHARGAKTYDTNWATVMRSLGKFSPRHCVDNYSKYFDREPKQTIEHIICKNCGKLKSTQVADRSVQDEALYKYATGTVYNSMKPTKSKTFTEKMA